MKTFFTLTAVVAGALLSGCASDRNGLVLGTVGPERAQPAAIHSTDGTLVVYSAYEAGADFYSRNEYGQRHSDYKIFTSDGKLLQKVHNDTGTILLDPVAVTLAPGNYRVVARANGYGEVTVPVSIESQQNTVIHLEGGGSWSNEPVSQANAVRLPDGLAIGWRADSN